MFFVIMIIEFTPFMLLTGAVYGVLRLVYLHSTGKQGKGGMGEFLQFCFVCYIFALCALVFFPEDFWDKVWYYFEKGEWYDSGFSFFGGSYTSRNLILQCFEGDFEGIIADKYSIIANVIMFIPLGFFLPLVFKRIKPVHSVLICLGVTCFIELVQPLICRTGDLDDVISNFVGGFIGAVISGIILAIKKTVKAEKA